MLRNVPPSALHADLLAYYERIYAAAVTPDWDAAPGKEVLLNGLALLKVTGRLGATGSLVDIGCGSGYLLGRIQQEILPHWALHGVDFAPTAIAQARARHPAIAWHCAPGEATPLPEGSMDVAVSYGSMEHFPDPVAGVGELARLLKPGGLFMLMLPALDAYRTDRTDEGWYPDLTGQPQWNWTRATWARAFASADLACWPLKAARPLGARKPGVFFFGDRQ
ncbi:MAG: class I SAM-dependent methyltransferase [Candidatus Rokuibacteriota bacterium]